MKSLLTGIVLGACCTVYAEKPQLHLEQGHRAIPIEMAQVVLVEGKMFMTTDWIPCHPGGGLAGDNGAIAGPGCQTVTYSPCGANNLVFDMFEPNPADGVPTDLDGSCVSAGVPAGNRYYFGSTHLNPFITNDMTVCDGAAGTHATGVDLAWHWGSGPDRPIYAAVFTAEAFGDCTLPDATGYYPGVIIHFDRLYIVGGYWYANIDYCGQVSNLLPGPGGAYSISLGQYDDQSGVFTLDTFAGTQPMLWGTEATRPGTQTAHQWDDIDPTDGRHDLVECADYTYDGVCNNPLGAMIAFRTGDCEPCDANCDGSVNLFDVEPFVDLLSQIGSPCRPCAADTNSDGSINLFDIQGFVNCVGG